MIKKERVCCICNEHKKFLARPNAGQKLYCMQCKAKITKEYGMDYWKPCSFGEFMGAFSKSLQKGKPPRPYSETPMADGLRRAWAEMGLEDTRKKPKKKKKRG